MPSGLPPFPPPKLGRPKARVVRPHPSSSSLSHASESSVSSAGGGGGGALLLRPGTEPPRSAECFLKWAKQHDVFIHPDVDVLHRTPEMGGFGVFAKKALKPGTVVISTPLAVAISPYSDQHPRLVGLQALASPPPLGLDPAASSSFLSSCGGASASLSPSPAGASSLQPSQSHLTTTTTTKSCARTPTPTMMARSTGANTHSSWGHPPDGPPTHRKETSVLLPLTRRDPVLAVVLTLLSEYAKGRHSTYFPWLQYCPRMNMHLFDLSQDQKSIFGLSSGCSSSSPLPSSLTTTTEIEKDEKKEKDGSVCGDWRRWTGISQALRDLRLEERWHIAQTEVFPFYPDIWPPPIVQYPFFCLCVAHVYSRNFHREEIIGREGPYLLPGLDFLNHAQPPNTIFEVTGGGRKHERCFTVQVCKKGNGIPAQGQIFASYGRIGSARFVSEFQFLSEDMERWDMCRFSCSQLVELATEILLFRETKKKSTSKPATKTITTTKEEDKEEGEGNERRRKAEREEKSPHSPSVLPPPEGGCDATSVGANISLLPSSAPHRFSSSSPVPSGGDVESDIPRRRALRKEVERRIELLQRMGLLFDEGVFLQGPGLFLASLTEEERNGLEERIHARPALRSSSSSSSSLSSSLLQDGSPPPPLPPLPLGDDEVRCATSPSTRDDGMKKDASKGSKRSSPFSSHPAEEEDGWEKDFLEDHEKEFRRFKAVTYLLLFSSSPQAFDELYYHQVSSYWAPPPTSSTRLLLLSLLGIKLDAVRLLWWEGVARLWRTDSPHEETSVKNVRNCSVSCCCRGGETQTNASKDISVEGKQRVDEGSPAAAGGGGAESENEKDASEGTPRNEEFCQTEKEMEGGEDGSCREKNRQDRGTTSGAAIGRNTTTTIPCTCDGDPFPCCDSPCPTTTNSTTTPSSMLEKSPSTVIFGSQLLHRCLRCEESVLIYHMSKVLPLLPPSSSSSSRQEV